MNTTPLGHEVTQLHAEICSALGDPRRILLLYALSEQSRNVCDLAGHKGTSIEYNLMDYRPIDALNTLQDIVRDRLTYRASLIEG